MFRFKLTKLTLATLGAVFGLGVILPGAAAWATEKDGKFPSKTIQVVIHSSYGGGTDTTARMMMVRARRTLGVDMQVVAKRGA